MLIVIARLCPTINDRVSWTDRPMLEVLRVFNKVWSNLIRSGQGPPRLDNKGDALP